MATFVNETQKYLDDIKGSKAIEQQTPDQVRLARKQSKFIQKAVGHLKDITTKYITVRDNQQIPIRYYIPQSTSDRVIIYFHGGGWVLNDLEVSEYSCSLMAQKLNSTVISVQYRKAPEHKFPVPVNDAFDAFNYIKNELQATFQSGMKIIVAGDSAGANLAIAVSQLAKEHEIAAQLLLYPVTNTNLDTESYLKYKEGYGLDLKTMEWFINHYLDEQFLAHPLAAPLNALNLQQQPTTYLKVAEFDVLHDEGVAFAKKLTENGVEVVLQEAKGVVHSFFTKPQYFKREIHQTVDQIQYFLKQTL